MSPIITTPNRQRSKAAPYMPSYMGEGQLCVVCGDLATGLHYRAITCEGCKGFFRRTAQRHLTYTCKGDERCEINKHTRNVCQRCRYLKCISEGMSNDLVLNDTERVQKRELIKENRERRQLETILNRMKESTIQEGAARELRIEIDRITKLYCQLIDQPISDLAATKGAESRMTEMLRPIIRRSTSFAKELGVWDKLPLTSQMELIHSSLLEVQILRFVSFFDETENCFRPTEQVFLRKHDLLETLPVDVMDTDDSDQLSLLVSGLFSLARSLASCQLDHRQLAVLSAIFIFNPDNLADMDTASLLTGYQTRLWDMFRLLSDESCDSPDIHRWPRMLARCAQLRVLCARLAKHFTAANVELFSAVLVV